MVFGTNALITKPAMSLAPMLTVYIFNKYGYEQLNTTAMLPPSVTSGLHHCMVTMAWVNAVVVGLLQMLVWSKFNITGL